jgi:hypothetical protein
MMSESFSQVLDTLILSEDVRGSVAVLHRFDAIGSRENISNEHRGLVGLIRENFARRMSEPQRVQAVGQYMTLAKNLDEMAVKAYLSVVSTDQLGLLIEMLETMERVEGRRILIEVLAQLGKNDTKLFAERLENKSSNVVKDMLAIIEKINPDNRLDLYAKCLDHPNIMIRLEGLKVIAKTQGDSALKYLEKAAEDADLQIRLSAYRGLATRNPSRACAILKKVMRAEDFLQRDQREQIAVVTALGETRADDAVEFFSSILEAKTGLLNRLAGGKTNELKHMAVKGLVAMRTVQAFKVLAREVQNRNQSKEIAEAALKAAQRLKAELSPQQGGSSVPPTGATS